MASTSEEHSERNEAERDESDNEKDPEHKSNADLDEAPTITTQNNPDRQEPESLQSVGLRSSEQPIGATGRPEQEELVGGSGSDQPPDYGAINPADIPNLKQITLDELLDNIGFRCYHYVVILILSIVTVGDVMETEVGILLGPTLLCEWKLTGLEEAMSTSSLYVGALIGSLIWGTVADRYGRKDTLIIMLLWIGIFGLVTCFSNGLVPYIILRLLTGIGVGGAYLPVTYATEMVNAKSRSFATLIIFFSAFIGTMLASTLAMFVLPLENGWKYYIVVSSSLVLLSCFFVAALVPESPRFLLLVGNHKGVIKVLRKFDKTLDEETYHYLQPVDIANERRGAVLELCKHKTRCLQFFVIAISWFLIKFNAMGIVLLYFERLQDKSLTSNCGDNHGIVKTSVMSKSDKCQQMGFDEYLKITIFNLEVGFGAIISYVAAECLGRIRGMILTNSIAVIFAVPLIFCMTEIILTIIVMISKSFSAASWYIMTLYINEYFPTYIRSVASGALDVFGRLGVIITPFVAQYLSKETMLGATCLYISFMLVGLILTWFLTYETKGKAQMDDKSRNTDDVEVEETMPIKGATSSPKEETKAAATETAATDDKGE